MMKSELKLAPHTRLPGAQVIEVWFGGKLIATVTGADGPGVRVLSKHPLAIVATEDAINVVQVVVVA